MWLFIEPNDVWLFRDGKPFDAGADHRARTFFPPTPSTLQGAIRRKVLTLYNIDFARYRQRDVDQSVADQVGLPPVYEVVAGQSTVKPGALGTLRLRGPFVARRETTGIVPYFPCPADMVKTEDEVVPQAGAHQRFRGELA